MWQSNAMEIGNMVKLRRRPCHLWRAGTDNVDCSRIVTLESKFQSTFLTASMQSHFVPKRVRRLLSNRSNTGAHACVAFDQLRPHLDPTVLSYVI